MTSIQVIAPAPMANTIANTKKGIASIRTIFSNSNTTKHHPPQTTPPSSKSSSSGSSPTTYGIPTLTSSTSISALFPSSGSKRTSMDQAADRDWKEQAKQVFQLSTVNDKGYFLPPTPTEKEFKENMKDGGEDYFTTIASTSPEKVKSFLSTESTLSPGMYSLPPGKIKRHMIPSFLPPITPTQHTNNTKDCPYNKTDDEGESSDIQSENLAVTQDATVHPSSVSSGSISTPPSSPSLKSQKDLGFLPSPPATPRSQQRQGSELKQVDDKRRKSRAQLSFLTGTRMEEEDEDLLSDSFGSFI